MNGEGHPGGREQSVKRADLSGISRGGPVVHETQTDLWIHYMLQARKSTKPFREPNMWKCAAF